MIVVIPPQINFITRLFNRPEPMQIQTFVPEFAINTFNKCIVGGLAWLDKIQPNSRFLTPEKHGLTLIKTNIKQD